MTGSTHRFILCARHSRTYLQIPMTDTPPDHLASDPRSPFHDAEALDRGVGIRFNGVERDNVEEYCVSEGWIRVPVGKSKDRRGNPMTMKVKGSVEAYFRSPATE
jgi:hypothetical protein